jgi:hypothetical protein
LLDTEIILNKSKTYLLYYFAETLQIKNFHLLRNTYLFYEGEQKICFLYKYSGKKEFSEYERSLELNEHYCKTVDVSKDKVLYVMHVPEGLDEIIELFLEGKYSQLPDKQGLISFLKIEFGANEESKIIKIIRKDAGLKRQIEQELGVKLEEQDLSSAPDFDKENFTKELYEKKPKHDDIRETDNISNNDDEQRNRQST